MKTFYSIGKGPAIDEVGGTIKQVSLMELGDAAGHFDKKGRQIKVDETTLRQVFEYCTKNGSLKVRADHGSGVMATIGWADNFSLTSDKVLADFHIYDTEPQRPRIFEIARKNPNHMGMSLEFEGEDEPKGDNCFARCTNVLATALVSDPAANKSLFSAIPPETTDTTKQMDKEQYEELSKKFDALTPLIEAQSALITKFAKKFEDDEAKAAEDDSDKKELEGDEDEDKKELEEGDDKADDKKELANAKFAEEFAGQFVKKFAASFGIVPLKPAGSPAEKEAKGKHFEEHVSELAFKQFDGDTTKARGHILTNFGKNPEWKKSYEAQRNVK